MSPKLRGKVYEKYGRRCAYCGRHIEFKDMQVDHFHPKDKPYEVNGIWKRADDSFENLMPSCRRCNHYKRAHDLEIYRRYLMEMRRKLLDTYLGKIAIDYGMIAWVGWDGKFYFEKVDEYHRLKG